MTTVPRSARSALIAFAIAAACALASGRAAAQAPAPADEIAGRWIGTSTCVKVDWNAACNDERVVYWFTPGDSPTKVTQHAYKYVGERLELMGDLEYDYDATTKSWNAGFSNSRVRIRWSLQVMPRGLMTGRLIDLGRGQLARTIRVQRDSVQTAPPPDSSS